MHKYKLLKRYKANNKQVVIGEYLNYATAKVALQFTRKWMTEKGVDYFLMRLK